MTFADASLLIQVLVSVFGYIFTAMDETVIITNPQITLLDFFVGDCGFFLLWDFVMWLSE